MTWMHRAACADRPSLAWLDDSTQVPAVVVDEMRLVCASCPVHVQCSRFVDEQDITGGFWAGLDRSKDSAIELGGAA